MSSSVEPVLQQMPHRPSASHPPWKPSSAFKKKAHLSFFSPSRYIGDNQYIGVFSPYWLSPITSFHHIGDNQYYRDILESISNHSRTVPSISLGVAMASTFLVLDVTAETCLTRKMMLLPLKLHVVVPDLVRSAHARMMAANSSVAELNFLLLIIASLLVVIHCLSALSQAQVSKDGNPLKTVAGAVS